MEPSHYQAVVIGGSAGSMEVFLQLFSILPDEISLPIIVLPHLHPDDGGGLVEFFRQKDRLRFREAIDKEQIQAGFIYFPSANYHLLVEIDKSFSLSIDPKVNYSRPSIDVLFESAALAWGDGLVGILLTGASSDGTEGIRAIKKYGGFTIVQEPLEAVCAVMPQSAIATGKVDRILSIEEMGRFLQKITGYGGEKL